MSLEWKLSQGPFQTLKSSHVCSRWWDSFLDSNSKQGGRTWQAFGGGKHGHETFRQARNYNFRDKCVVFARNLKFSNLTQ